MTDVYVYYFLVRDGSTNETVLSRWPATLDAIKGKGEPVMESQIVADHTEIDGDGFLIAGMVNGSHGANGAHAVNDLTAQIKSVELRAASRDREALNLDEATQGKDRYMLSLESRELRSQAKKLKKLRADLMADELSRDNETFDIENFGYKVNAE
jgi:hypothetical protein